MSKARELKPCPFCNGSAHIRPSQDADGCFWSWVQCNQCGARTQGDWASNRSETCPIFYEGVREEWNRRAASSEQQAAQQDADTIALPRKEWEELKYYLDRCYDKGHLDQCFDLVEPLEALNAAIAARASNGGKA